jgi:glycosyltransferase involved in cell wall biosynthesis
MASVGRAFRAGVDMKKILVVVPWLEGGGAQSALLGLLEHLPREDVHLVILFEGSRNHQQVLDAVASSSIFDLSRTAIGAIVAARRLRRLIPGYTRIYSLMRASHVVLGLANLKQATYVRLAATMHQLPSSERNGLRGRGEEVLIRRVLRRAKLVTAPSERAIAELLDFGLSTAENTHFEPNILRLSTSDRRPPREATLDTLRLVFGGRLSKQKGLDNLLLALMRATKQVDLRILGDGPTQGSAIARECQGCV